MNLVGVWKESFSSESEGSEMELRIPVRTARHRFPVQKYLAFMFIRVSYADMFLSGIGLRTAS